MKNKSTIIRNVSKAHENKWVALSANRKEVLGSSDKLENLRKKFGNTKVIYTRILPPDRFFAF